MSIFVLCNEGITKNMTKESLRIVYMGTPDFAVESLRCLVEGGYNVVGVVTGPDKAVGRHGSVLQPTPVKQYAVEHGLRVLQPEKLKDEAFIEELRALQADLQIVVAFRMLPEVVWSMPPLGTFNLHASLLPQYRGAAPINWAVINGDTETGVTTFFLKHEIDTGAVIRQVRVPISDTDCVGDVHDRLMLLGGGVVCETVDAIIDGSAQATPQEMMMTDEELRPAPKIFKDTCAIDFSRNAEQIRNHVRGLSPYPAAWIKEMPEQHPLADVLRGAKVYKATVTQHADQKGHIIVPCADGYIDLLELQLPGKKRMDAAALLNGIRVNS
jgi:methionyl-tRNA formyltransferase